MKINAKIYRSLNSEPIEVQEINGKQVEVHYMNETKYLSQYIPRGRFYLWTSDGNNYRLLVEKGFHEKLDYFFTEQINTVWINYLEDVGRTDSKSNRNYMFGSLIAMVLVVVGSTLFLESNQVIWVMIGFFVLSMIINVFQSRKIRERVKQKNYEAQDLIRTILTEEGFEKLIKDQEEYVKEYFDYEDDEENDLLEEENNLLEKGNEEEAIKEIEIVEKGEEE